MDVGPVNSPEQLPAAVPEPANSNWLVENRDLIRSIKSINASELFAEGSELTFAFDRDTKRPVVRVVNPQTGEILWQAPPEYMLHLAQTLGRPADRPRNSGSILPI